jgi:hypothetical protein
MMIKIDFQVETAYGVYRDAIYLPENHQHTDAEIELMKQERVTNWLLAIETQSEPEPEPEV